MDGLTFDFTVTDGNEAIPIVVDAADGDTTITSDGVINIVDPAVDNDIYLNGALSLNHKILNNVIVTEVLVDTQYFVEVTSTTTTPVQLPAASANVGRQYIILNSKAATLTVTTTGGDTVDDLSTVELDVICLLFTVTLIGVDALIIF